jgi:(p)ppGpp synthase/HD superfamily hydrolase
MQAPWSIDELQDLWKLVSKLHDGQKYGGQEEGEKVEYLNHIGSVTFEILNAINVEQSLNADLAIKCAMLHDTIEDTEHSYEKVKATFGQEVADGVLALTKNETLPDKEAMMLDSLQRIKQQPKAVWAVKMADRISNLYAPPFYWTNEKKSSYLTEARLILRELKDGSPYLASRLEQKIDAYGKYLASYKL